MNIQWDGVVLSSSSVCKYFMIIISTWGFTHRNRGQNLLRLPPLFYFFDQHSPRRRWWATYRNIDETLPGKCQVIHLFGHRNHKWQCKVVNNPVADVKQFRVQSWERENTEIGKSQLNPGFKFNKFPLKSVEIKSFNAEQSSTATPTA